MAVQLTKEEKLECAKLQIIYDKRRRETEKYENTCTFGLIARGLAPTCEEARLKMQQRQEEEFKRRVSKIEEGEIVDMIIELADYRRFRCVYGLHLEPKQRVVELTNALV